MKILVACEESQTVCLAFRRRGHEAYSCDLQDCSGGHPEFHLKMDALEAIKLQKWDLIVAHPPCTYFSRAASQFIHTQPDRKEKRERAFEFVKAIWDSPCKKLALENPPGWLCTNWKEPKQIIHPYYFGDGEMKETALWLRGLPRLNGLISIDRHRDKPKPVRSRMGADGKMKNIRFVFLAKNAKERSKTFPGIARAMAQQWTPDLKYFNTTTFISQYAEL